MSDLKRFLDGQENSYDIALSEIKNGYKQSHWIWFIFPQLKGLGMSQISEYYGINGMEEAKEYLSSPVLRKRLEEISEVLLNNKNDDISYIMGYPDDLKLKSSMTLFYIASGENNDSVYKKVLDRFYDGKMDDVTLEKLGYEIERDTEIC